MARNRAARPEAKPLRLFVGARIPDEVVAIMSAAVDPLRERFSAARWVPPQNWHVTLKFLGRTWPRLLDWVGEELDLVARTEMVFETSLLGFGVFPSDRRARVLWAGLSDAEGRFGRLAGAIDAALSREFEPESRAFTPHITIARFDPPVPMPGDAVTTGPTSEPFAVDELVLYRSHLRRPAPVYEPVRVFPLRGGRRGVRGAADP